MEFSASTRLTDNIQAPKTILCHIIWRAHKVSPYPCSTKKAYHVTYCNLKEALQSFIHGGFLSSQRL